MMKFSSPLRALAIVVLCAGTAPFVGHAAYAAETLSVTVVIKNHKFEPDEIRVPAGATVRLTIRNADPTPEEFESHDLNLEKIVTGGASVVLQFGPLKPGTYRFVGEFNEDSAKGRIVAE